jgi:molybdenum cofactor biosynthesis enzyme MoaA
MKHPFLRLQSLDNLWFQVAGTLCNLRCHHCFISCSPENHSFGFLTLAEVKARLAESEALGVKEYYFTGGEPFANRELLAILEETLRHGPATVLTNGTLITPEIAQQLAALFDATIYSLEIRVSIDGFSPESNDPIRGDGTFVRAMRGVRHLVAAGLLPIITAMRSWDIQDDDVHLAGFRKALKNIGYDRPRIKLLPSLKLGAETGRTRGYTEEEIVTEEMLGGYDTAQLLCANSRIVTDKGVYVCPILIDSPDARLGETLAEATTGYTLGHRACYTCWQFGAICSNTTARPREA